MDVGMLFQHRGPATEKARFSDFKVTLHLGSQTCSCTRCRHPNTGKIKRVREVHFKPFSSISSSHFPHLPLSPPSCPPLPVPLPYVSPTLQYSPLTSASTKI